MTYLRFILPLVVLLTSTFSFAGDASLLERLKALVEINSGSANIDGVTQVQNKVASELKALGFNIELGSNQLLVGTLKGSSPKQLR